MKTGCGVGKKQGGAVAIMVGLLSFFMLIGMLGIAVDLSQLYSRKTELQNAADAAALSGAKDLNQTAAGVAKAINDAIATFAQNSGSNLIGGIAITAANIRVGSCPNPSDRLPLRNPNCSFVAASSVTSDALAAGMTFIEVDTGNHSNATYFMPTHLLQGTATTGVGTYGYAVAGRFVQNVTPIAVCAITKTKYIDYPTGERLEYGFRRGVSYNIIDLDPLGGSPNKFLLNPVDVPPGACNPSHASASFTNPFLCMGNSAVASNIATSPTVYVNTGFSSSADAQLNSRFDVFGGASKCDPATAPPDTNIKQYTHGANPPWMAPDTTTQDFVGQTNHIPDYFNIANPTVPKAMTYTNYGVLSSYTQALKSDGSNFAATNINWNQLYSAPLGATPPTSYPSPSPYLSGLSAYSQKPSGANGTGVAGRRMLNLVIVDCTTLSGSGSCATIKALGIGRFFMTQRANLPGSIITEYAGLISPVPEADIKLYR